MLLRADIDALLVEERTELSYPSEVRIKDIQDGIEKPVMHAGDMTCISHACSLPPISCLASKLKIAARGSLWLYSSLVRKGARARGRKGYGKRRTLREGTNAGRCPRATCHASENWMSGIEVRYHDGCRR